MEENEAQVKYQYLKTVLKALLIDFWPQEGRRTPQQGNKHSPDISLYEVWS